MGSISGVNPTATVKANKKASTQLPLVNPFTKKTIGTITKINRINNQLTLLTPLSKLVSRRLLVRVLLKDPK